MFCQHCQYNLHGLTRYRCPECGREFDPDDPATFDPKPTSCAHWPLWLVAAGAAYPWLAVCGLATTWLTACVVLGRPPRPSADDPLEIGTVVSIVYYFTALSCMTAPFALMLTAVGLVAIARTWPYPRRHPTVLAFAGTVISWFLAFVTLTGRLHEVGVWFMD
jgi:hypothetical protein